MSECKADAFDLEKCWGMSLAYEKCQFPAIIKFTLAKFL